MKVLHVAAEVFPLIKTGGLADVVGALPQALIKAGADVRLMIPGFDAVVSGVHNRRLVTHIGAVFGAAKVDLYVGELASGVTAYVVDAPYLYAGRQNPYLDLQGHEWPDNLQRYCLLGWVAAQLAAGQLDSTWQPHVVHAHDWHAAMVCAYLANHPANQVKSVFTIHNLAYQGLFAANEYHHTTLPNELFVMDGLEYHGKLSLMKAGLVYAHHITTVSPTYAKEIATPEFGHGLDGMIRARGRDVSGILNGVDGEIWNPATDSHLKAHYKANQLLGKALCKAALQEEFGLTVNANRPLLCVVSRLTSQKGLDLLTAIVPRLVDELGIQLIVQGQGDPDLERALRSAHSAYRTSVGLRLGYDEGAAHRIMSGADAILVPSRFEPCGLTQLYGLRYGTVPVVSAVGGLVDTVVGVNTPTLKNQTATGFNFSPISSDTLFAAISQAVKCYRDKPAWNQLLVRAMNQNFSWDSAASKYLALYASLVTNGGSERTV